MDKPRLRTCGFIVVVLITMLLIPVSQKRKPAVPEPQEPPALLAPPAAPSIPRLSWNTEDETARFISGMPVDSSSALAPLMMTPAWRRYRSVTDSNWSVFKSRLDRIREWAARELGDLKTGGNVFYPFSGPDFASIHALFPEADRYTFFGLEPVGRIPDILSVPPDSLESIFSAVIRDLDDIMNLTFFKTRNMRTELADRTVQGTLPLLMYFIARTGYHITSVKPFAIDTSGSIACCDTFLSVPGKRVFNRGVEIRFQENDSARTQTLLFFTADVSNGGLLSNGNARKLLEKLDGGQTTYIKAASYLMHIRYFSMIREIILSTSACILQDDSGIPYRFFPPPEWTVTLYGSYSKPYRLFKDYPDKELKKAYDTGDARPLDIRFGYQTESNLQLAVKNR
jgi:hypothetical protein